MLGGTVEAFDAQNATGRLATALNMSADHVTLSAEAASVRVQAVISVPSELEITVRCVLSGILADETRVLAIFGEDTFP